MMVKGHLSKWQIAYIRWSCLCIVSAGTYLHSELKGYSSFEQITAIEIVEMFLWTIVVIATTTAAFLDKSSQQPEKKESEIKL